MHGAWPTQSQALNPTHLFHGCKQTLSVASRGRKNTPQVHVGQLACGLAEGLRGLGLAELLDNRGVLHGPLVLRLEGILNDGDGNGEKLPFETIMFASH